MPSTTTVLQGNVIVTGSFTAAALTPSAGAVRDNQVAADANIDPSKVGQRHHQRYSQPNTAATTITIALHVAQAAGAVIDFYAGSIAKAVGDSVVTLDLKKNGATILTAPITLDNANTNRLAEYATLASAVLAAEDLLEAVITATVGTGTLPTGLFCGVILDEDAY